MHQLVSDGQRDSRLMSAEETMVALWLNGSLMQCAYSTVMGNGTPV